MVPRQPYVVKSEPGPGTATGEGNILTDNYGGRWRVVSNAEANILRQGTGNRVATLHPDGTIW